MKNMMSELEARGYEYTVCDGSGLFDEYINLYLGSSRCNGNLIGCYKVYYGNKGSYIRYNRHTYYFD